MTPGNVFFQDGVQNCRRNPLIVRPLKRTTKFDNLGVYPQIFGGKEHIKTSFDITKLMNHYEIIFMSFNCPLSPCKNTFLHRMSSMQVQF